MRTIATVARAVIAVLLRAAKRWAAPGSGPKLSVS
jgi:hypothetical protein